MPGIKTAHLDEKGRQIADRILQEAKRLVGREVFTGGCQPFYTAAQWAERGEEYGEGSLLIVVYDGGDLAAMFNGVGVGSWYLAMERALGELGVYAEEKTCWYSAVYPI